MTESRALLRPRAVYFSLMPLRPDKWSCWRARNLRGEGSRARSKREHKVKTKARGSRFRLQRAKPACTLSGEVCQIFTHVMRRVIHFVTHLLTKSWFKMCSRFKKMPLISITRPLTNSRFYIIDVACNT